MLLRSVLCHFLVAGRQIRLEYEVAAAFMHEPVLELLDENPDRGAAGQVSRYLPASVSSSSRAKCSRKARGEALSK